MNDLDISTYRKARVSWSESIEVEALVYPAEQIITTLAPLLTLERIDRLKSVIGQRTRNVCTVLENIYDLGNISAVMRSAESFGFLPMHLISKPGAKFKAANRVSKGAEKWLDVHLFSTARDSMGELKKSGYQILATHLDAAKPLSEIDFAKPTALVFGNEKDGVSPEILSLVDERVKIPMQGFSQSFNISVAAAIVFYHAWAARQRAFGQSGDLSAKDKTMLYANYLLRCFDSPEKILRSR